MLLKWRRKCWRDHTGSYFPTQIIMHCKLRPNRCWQRHGYCPRLLWISRRSLQEVDPTAGSKRCGCKIRRHSPPPLSRHWLFGCGPFDSEARGSGRRATTTTATRLLLTACSNLPTPSYPTPQSPTPYDAPFSHSRHTFRYKRDYSNPSCDHSTLTLVSQTPDEHGFWSRATAGLDLGIGSGALTSIVQKYWMCSVQWTFDICIILSNETLKPCLSEYFSGLLSLRFE